MKWIDAHVYWYTRRRAVICSKQWLLSKKGFLKMMRAGGLVRKVWKNGSSDFYMGSSHYFDMIFFSSESSNRDPEKNKIFVAGRIFWDPRNFLESQNSEWAIIFGSRFLTFLTLLCSFGSKVLGVWGISAWLGQNDWSFQNSCSADVTFFRNLFTFCSMNLRDFGTKSFFGWLICSFITKNTAFLPSQIWILVLTSFQ